MKLPNPHLVEVYIEDTKLHSLKILHLSDLHIDQKTSVQTLKKLVKVCENLEIDFIALTGDIIDCKVKYIKNKLSILNTISKKVYYISGNHDLFYGLEALKKELSNFIFLDNTIQKIDFKGNAIHIVGLSDRFSELFNHKRETLKIASFLMKNDASILLAHQPKDYKIASKTNTSLFLCGHTHGGQIYPFHYLVRLVQPFLNGLHYVHQTAVYVSSGLGTWGVKYRYKANPEITVLNLIAKKVQ